MATGGPQPQIREFAAHLREFFALLQPQMAFSCRKLEPQTLLLFCPDLINRGDLFYSSNKLHISYVDYL